MRGKVKFFHFFFLRDRITPAYAGKSGGTGGGRGLRWDHPRLCGEKFCNDQFGRSIQGSPPPMRGKALLIIVFLLTVRITPAYAGKSGFRCFQKVLFLGSPPPMRGKAIEGICSNHGDRITPAYAGKRWLAIWRQCYREDHPRLCGEKTEILFTHGCHLGSPPPMRGKGSITRNVT